MDKLKDLFKQVKPYFVYLFALAGGACLPYAFAPYYQGIIALISPGILLWCLAKRSPSKAFLIGWLYGVGLFGLGAYWIYVSIHDYGYASPLLAGFLTSVFIMGMALYPAIMSALLNRYFPKNNRTRCIIAFPVLWTLFEILRGWIFTGFPWLYVGYSQMGILLSSFAPVGSVWLVSFATVLVSSLLYCIVDYYYSYKDNNKLRNQLIFTMIAVWGVAFGCHRITWNFPTDKTLTVSLVQGNIQQLMRWDPAHVGEILGTYQALTEQAVNSNTHLVIWPEGAVPTPLPLSQAFFQNLDNYAKVHNIGIISGVPTQLPDQAHYYNSLYGVGAASGIYFKEKLVPFGEYVPFEGLLRGLIAFFNLPMSSFVEGPADQKPLTAFGFTFAPAICYEIAYPFFVQSMVQNADFILTVSNDTWFGKSIGPLQHLQIAQFRALETGKYVIRATNSGYTAIISPSDEIEQIAAPFEPNVTTGTITVMEGQTWWVRYGVWTLSGILGLFLMLAVILRSREKD